MFIRFKRLYDADDGNKGGSGGDDGNKGSDKNDNGETKAPEIDYEKLSSLIAGKQTVAEDSVLKGYFKQQGLSKEEADKAISDFKAKKEAEKPDFEKINKDLEAAKNAALEASLKVEAYKLAGGLGIDTKAIEYVIKLADTSECIADGKVSTEKLTEALNKVLSDVPAFKAAPADVKKFKVGSDGDDKGDSKELALRKAMGLE